jgi:hypothetical protein
MMDLCFGKGVPETLPQYLQRHGIAILFYDLDFSMVWKSILRCLVPLFCPSRYYRPCSKTKRNKSSQLVAHSVDKDNEKLIGTSRICLNLPWHFSISLCPNNVLVPKPSIGKYSSNKQEGNYSSVDAARYPLHESISSWTFLGGCNLRAHGSLCATTSSSASSSSDN